MSHRTDTYTAGRSFRNWFHRLAVCLVLLLPGVAAAQEDSTVVAPETNTFKDTVFLYESDMDGIVTYSARDSIYSDLRAKKIHLYGNASLNYEGVDMKAEYLLIDLDKNEVFATYVEDSLGKRIGSPVFSDGGDTIHAASIRYNFQTKKGYIQEVGIQQDEIYLTMETAKRHANEEVHFVRGKFTTCNLKEPHYHFFLSKAVLIPEKRIVTGPMNLWIMGVPTPLGLPFSIIPQRKDREAQSGFIMPQIAAFSPYGFGLQDLGYYFPISDRLQTTVYGTLFSRGSFGFKNETEYNVRYKFQGGFSAGYQFFREGFPSTETRSAMTLRWTHNQDPKANPKWRFTSDVNFNSQNSNKVALNQQTEAYFNNTLNSDIRVDRFFVGKPIQMSLRASMRQNSSSPTINFTAPVFNVSTTRFYPLKRRNASDGKTRFYETIGVTYNLEMKNQSDFKSQYLRNGDFDSIAQQFRNGVNHTAVATTTINLFKNTVRLTPSVTYNQKYNFQSIRKTFDTSTNTVQIDSLNRGVFSHNLTFSAGLTTNLYSYYRFIGKRKTLLRHVMTPAITFYAGPNIQNGIGQYADNTGKVYNYSTLENSVYSERYLQDGGRIDFALGNTFELKYKSDKDTVTGFRKLRIIENLNFNTSYDIFKDSMNWTDLTARMVITPVEVINIAVTANHSWYGWDTKTGVSSSKYATRTGQGIGRLVDFSISTSYTLMPKEQRSLPNQTAMANVWNPQYDQWMLLPAQVVDFRIPWRATLSHILSYSLNRDPNNFASRRYVPNNTLALSADVSITQNWKIAARTFVDAMAGKVTNTQIDLVRNLHCWNMSFTWTPIGTNKSFLISIRGNGNALSNVFFNLRKPQSLFQ